MIDSGLAAQLEKVFANLEHSVTLVHRPSSHPKQSELVAMLEAMAETSPQVTVREDGEASGVPRFRLEHGGQPSASY